jgi:hypothetical protein
LSARSGFAFACQHGGFQEVGKGLRMLKCLLAEVLTSARQGAC